MTMDIQDNSALAGRNVSVTTNGNNNGQIAVGAAVIQIGTVNDSEINFRPAASTAAGSPPAEDPALLPPAAEQEELVALRQILSSLFDQEELRDLAFDLAVDYDSLPGAAKKDKARELVAFCRRHGRLDELKRAVLLRRPGVF
jgi:hypothetical protein